MNDIGPETITSVAEYKSAIEAAQEEIRNLLNLKASKDLYCDQIEKEIRQEKEFQFQRYSDLDGVNIKLSEELASLKAAHEELKSYLPKIPTQPYEKEIAQQLTAEREKSKALVEELEKIDWHIREMQNEKIISMKEMIRALKVISNTHEPRTGE